MRRGGAWSTLVTVLLWAESAIVDAVSVFTRFDGGDVGGDVMRSVAVVIVWSRVASCEFTPTTDFRCGSKNQFRETRLDAPRLSIN
jgi:hypothetical protein